MHLTKAFLYIKYLFKLNKGLNRGCEVWTFYDIVTVFKGSAPVMETFDHLRRHLKLAAHAEGAWHVKFQANKCNKKVNQIGVHPNSKIPDWSVDLLF
jgi:hypothetical protein